VSRSRSLCQPVLGFWASTRAFIRALVAHFVFLSLFVVNQAYAIPFEINDTFGSNRNIFAGKGAVAYGFSAFGDF